MARVVAVHGINNTYSAPSMMAAEWVPALLGGVELAGGKGVLREGDVGCAFYGDLFRRPGRLLGDEDVAWLTVDDLDGDDEALLLAEWWKAASEVDPAVVPPGQRTLGTLDMARAALVALSGSRLLAGAAEQFLIFWLRQVRAYFTQPGVREQVQRRLVDAVGPDTQVLVAHSLGSVVAYEALCAHPEWTVGAVVTLGSPLGIRNVVLDRLVPTPQRVDGSVRGVRPGQVASWTNIVDRVDFVPLVKRLRPVFGERVVDVEIDNGVRMHDVRRYLTAAETGAAVLGGVGGRAQGG